LTQNWIKTTQHFLEWAKWLNKLIKKYAELALKMKNKITYGFFNWLPEDSAHN